ncbi:hypothetical protein EN781_00390 [Mesorhizobium sp. M4A.F.Ca.ET.090.04.2.1]|uniref:hypothetical protein n=1 Tax=Mesorhizobium sp. M4A.F.Ca.ET.090.04.2.1 TaxID=2496663 RepID=UPI000FCA260F|nr:hypothetical protein [Mesorhizobium sp. M4A.F.Ca.ET.090.04.2.1]RVC47627.1 hypothetical protein EN781_00390 [Mesorhizobium sp. M4A.F.Ca.ET.090.04.2.1]
MKVIDFSRRCAGLSSIAAKWAHDTLSTLPADVDQEEHPDTVRRFIAEMRERLNYIEEKLNG